MRSVSGNIRFGRSYPLARFEHVQNFERTPPDNDVRWMNVSCALVCGLSGSRSYPHISLDKLKTKVET